MAESVVHGRNNTSSCACQVKVHHDNAFFKIFKALQLDDDGDFPEALILYQEGLQSMEKGVLIGCTPEQGKDDTDSLKHGRKLQTKMLETYPKIQERIMEVLHITSPTLEDQRQAQDEPPSYDEVMKEASLQQQCSSNTSTTTTTTTNNSQYNVPHSISYSDEDYDTLEDSFQFNSQSSLDPTADILINFQNCVQIYFVTSRGNVSAPSSMCNLRVVKFRRPTPEGVSVFLSVGDWMYPLIPGQSPVLRSAIGSYMFPDTASVDCRDTVGVVINCSKSKIGQLEQVFNEFSVYKEEGTVSAVTPVPIHPPPRPKQPPTTKPDKLPQQDHIATPSTVTGKYPSISSEDVQKAITTGAKWMSWAVTKGSVYVDWGLKTGSNKLRSYLQPELGKVDVNPKYEKGVYYARQASGVAVKVSKTIVDCLADMTYKLGRELAPHVKHHGKKILPSSMKNKDEQVNSVLNVAATGLEGFATVYNALETAAKLIAKSMADETVETVTHKYGDAAGRVTEHSLYTVGNIGLTAYNVDNLTLKALAKRTVKDTGKAVIHSGEPTASLDETTVPPNSSPRPSLQQTPSNQQQTPSNQQILKQQ